MLSKSHSVTGGSYPSVGHKKKKAPPRPPPPSNSTIKTSQSFGTSGGLRTQTQRNSFAHKPSHSVDGGGGPNDLIDWGTPPGSPEAQRKVSSVGTKLREPDFMYRVGASIFYIPSPLKHKGGQTPSANPFSPPRPSAQAMLASPAKHSTIYSNVPTQNQSQVVMSQSATSGSTKYNPTIIKRPAPENNNTIKSVNDNRFGGGSVRSSSGSGSSDWSDYSQNSQTQSSYPQQPRYGNVPVAWDEPPAQHREEVLKPIEPLAPKSSQASASILPTIIKPLVAVKPSLLPKPSLSKTSMSANQSKIINEVTNLKDERNYYDEPPDFDDFDDEDHESSYISPPMPSEPPPPPPPEVQIAASSDIGHSWDQSSSPNNAPTSNADYASYHSTTKHVKVAEADRAYAITLYDYLSDIEGDLPLQAGDLVYLMKSIDDQWLYGQCAGVEGMFPANYVNVVVPLPEEESSNESHEHPKQPFVPKSTDQVWFTDAQYQFDAVEDGDLSLKAGDMVKIYGKVNDDWLYGEVCGQVGQFPATFVDPVPTDLPVINAQS